MISNTEKQNLPENSNEIRLEESKREKKVWVCVCVCVCVCKIKLQEKTKCVSMTFVLRKVTLFSKRLDFVPSFFFKWWSIFLYFKPGLGRDIMGSKSKQNKNTRQPLIFFLLAEMQ